MINKKEFQVMANKLKAYNESREELIKKARDLLKTSKQLIYALHRHNLKEAIKVFNEVKKEKSNLDKIARNSPRLIYEGSYSEACQEYVEAVCYYAFVKNLNVPSAVSLNVDIEDYLMGISDLTGELTRRAVTIANKDAKAFIKIKELVEGVFGEFLKFDLRNGNLRKKADQIKWNLKKLEDIGYDIERK